jgi:type II restriction/modification system DNA methylase subunit YeeA
MKITYQQVEQNISKIANRSNYTKDILFELLAAYGRSASAITQLRNGITNKATDEDCMLQKDIVYFKAFPYNTELIEKIDELENSPLTERYQPRYLIVTDLINFVAKDLKKGTSLVIKITDIDQQIDFFYGWTGDEITDDKHEAVVDRRAADKMKELYSEIEKENLVRFAKEGNTFRHDLNVFFSRLLFCFFAEDTQIFKKKQFSDALKNHTNTDGSDLEAFFTYLFKSLDSESKAGLSTPFSEFPYVNGSIFNTSKHSIAIPTFNAQSRHLILECAKSNWGEINPDIFGTLFQSIVDESKKDQNGMDYTSVPNILKVIEPLFLDELHELFDKFYDNSNKLIKLLVRIGKIKLFDPACGSGNFLIISYKKLRELEHAIIARLNELSPTHKYTTAGLASLIKLENFYGIEIDDFAHEIAILSLYLAAHQMNIEFEKQFGKSISIIPLIDIPTIICGNAARIDWQEVCPNVGHKLTKIEQEEMFEINNIENKTPAIDEKFYDEIYIIGNPPYKGARKQTPEQKEDLKYYFRNEEYSGNLDYISVWFIKGSRYIAKTKARMAFVSTNSIVQGEHVSIIFPKIFDESIEIEFAYTSFKWQNSARGNAKVTVIIIGLRSVSKELKYLFTSGIKSEVKNINQYLINGNNLFIEKKNKSISGLRKMSFGSMPNDGGNLIFEISQYLEQINLEPETSKYFKKFAGADDFINGKVRYCLWITDFERKEAEAYERIKDRINKVRIHREESNRIATNKLAVEPHKFGEIRYQPTNSIIIPRVSSERREYIPMGFLDEDTVISDAANAIYDAELWLFALLESKMHMTWIRTVCGKLKTDYRYSSTLGYNTFPVPTLTSDQKDILNKSARDILLTRENHSEKTLSDMYDPNKMPKDLKNAHEINDNIVDQLYRKKGFVSDEERLSVLFDMYENMVSNTNRS